MGSGKLALIWLLAGIFIVLGATGPVLSLLAPGGVSQAVADAIDIMMKPAAVVSCGLWLGAEIWIAVFGRRRRRAAVPKAERAAPSHAPETKAALAHLELICAMLGTDGPAFFSACRRRLLENEEQFLAQIRAGKSIEGGACFLASEVLHDALWTRASKRKLKAEDGVMLRACLANLAKAQELGFADPSACRARAESLRGLAQGGRGIGR